MAAIGQIVQRMGFGLVDIAALGTLLGTTSAETLTLGLKGTSGLPWAVMSFFGILNIAKINLAAAVPRRIRQAIGLRSDQVDLAEGFHSTVDTTQDWRGDEEPASVCAISIVTAPNSDSKRDDADPQDARQKAGVTYMYRMDKNTSKLMSIIPSAVPGEEIIPHFFHYDEISKSRAARVARIDWLVLTASLVKVLEAGMLWRAGASVVWYVTVLPWAHSFVSALILQGMRIGRDHPGIQGVDILAGELPSALRPGAGGKIILGAPATLRNHYAWKTVWISGAITNCASVIVTFLILSSQPVPVLYIWICFQVLWLAGQMVVYQVLPLGPAIEGSLVSRRWHRQPSEMNHRVLGLAFGLARQQVTQHPRRVMYYQEDIFSFPEVAFLLAEAEWKTSRTAPLADPIVEILAVVGDTLLRSIVYITGLYLDYPQLYDCCMVIIRTGEQVHVVPCVRVLGLSIKQNESDVMASFDPQGTTHLGWGVQWLLWIPIEGETYPTRWLEISGQKVLGVCAGTLLEKDKLHKRLSKGTLDISLSGVDDLERTLETSRKTGEALVRRVRDAEFYKELRDGG